MQPRRLSTIAMITVAAFALSACTPGREKEEWGTVLGAVAGGVLGSAIDHHGSGGAAAISIGAIAGAAVGNSIGASLDKTDRLEMEQARQKALESARANQSVEWHNPDSGNQGAITPQPAYRNDQGQYCREYRQTVTIAGKQEDAYGTACRQADGSWRIMS